MLFLYLSEIHYDAFWSSGSFVWSGLLIALTFLPHIFCITDAITLYEKVHSLAFCMVGVVRNEGHRMPALKLQET